MRREEEIICTRFDNKSFCNWNPWFPWLMWLDLAIILNAKQHTDQTKRKKQAHASLKNWISSQNKKKKLYTNANFSMHKRLEITIPSNPSFQWSFLESQGTVDVPSLCTCSQVMGRWAALRLLYSLSIWLLATDGAFYAHAIYSKI